MSEVYIYGLFDTILRYVGKTSRTLEKRFKQHLEPNSLKHKTRKNSWIKSLLNKGEKPDIFLLEICDENNWQEREKWWIAYCRGLDYDLKNDLPGGEGGGHKGRPLSEAHKEILRIRSTGRKHTPESKEKMSLAKKGVPKSKEFKDNVSRTQTGRIKSEEERKHISEALRGEKSTWSKLTNLQRDEIVKLSKSGVRQVDLMKMFKMSKGGIQHVLKYWKLPLDKPSVL